MSGSKEITRQCDESDAWQDEAAAVEDPENPAADPPAEFAAFVLRRARGPLSLWASGHLNVRERWAASRTDGPAWSDASTPCRVRSPFASWTLAATPPPSPTRPHPPPVVIAGDTAAERPFSDGPPAADAEAGAAEKATVHAPKPDEDEDEDKDDDDDNDDDNDNDDKRQPAADEEESSGKE